MNIREARIEDAPRIKILIEQLGYECEDNFIHRKMEKLFRSESDTIIVYEVDKVVVGLMTLHYSIQLAFEGDIMSIVYLVVDERYRNLQIGKKLEEYAVSIAKEKQCSFIEVFSLAKRADAHRFYERQGYTAIEKFFSKDINP